ncbi:RNA polymerase sigma-70 factor, ECF subfamily [bacterium A37T11]|nr:RNA polymerase sigma-70 factor, ECF subfamily [bacterium A37T11]
MGKPRSGKDIEIDVDFIRLFNTHWDEVYRLCLRYCGNEDLSKDLTQNIFLSVWERGNTFEDEQSAWQYLAKAARYQVLNHLRNEKPREVITESTGSGNLIEANRYNPEDIYMTVEFAEEMTQRINLLAEPGRTMFLLSREQQLSYRQIAEQLGIAVKTVEKHMSQVLRILRQFQ